jgi:hypothetical protein
VTTGVVDTGGKFAAGVNDVGGKFDGVNQRMLQISSRIRNDTKGISGGGGLGEVDNLNKKYCDTVPLTFYLLFILCSGRSKSWPPTRGSSARRSSTAARTTAARRRMTMTTARGGDDTGTTTMTVIMNWLLSIINKEGGRLKQMTFDNILEIAIKVVFQKFSYLFARNSL